MEEYAYGFQSFMLNTVTPLLNISAESIKHWRDVLPIRQNLNTTSSSKRKRVNDSTFQTPVPSNKKSQLSQTLFLS